MEFIQDHSRGLLRLIRPACGDFSLYLYHTCVCAINGNDTWFCSLQVRVFCQHASVQHCFDPWDCYYYVMPKENRTGFCCRKLPIPLFINLCDKSEWYSFLPTTCMRFLFPRLNNQVNFSSLSFFGQCANASILLCQGSFLLVCHLYPLYFKEGKQKTILLFGVNMILKFLEVFQVKGK